MAAKEGIPIVELMDEHTTLEQAYLDLTADATEFASAGRREV